MDYLSLAQFDLLVWVLSCLTLETDFKSLLTPKNIWEVTDHPKEFVPQDVPRINFLRPANAQAREWVQSNLLECIKEGAYEEMFEEDLGLRFPIMPSTTPTLPLMSVKIIYALSSFHKLF